MRCYTVSDIVTPGLRLYSEANGMFVRCGDLQIPAANSIELDVKEVRKEAEELLSTASPEEREAVEELLNSDYICLLHAGLGSDPKRVLTRVPKKERIENQDTRMPALVSVEIPAGHNGTIRFEGRGYQERLEAAASYPHVLRQNEAFPPAGINVVLESKNEMLLVMMPGSGFCAQRTGDLAGAAPRLVVSWNGWPDGLRVKEYTPQHRRAA